MTRPPETPAWGRSLLARFDSTVMRVEPLLPASVSGVAPLGTAEQAVWTALQRWCWAGVGDGRSPFWRPAALPRVDRRLTAATLSAGPPDRRASLVEVFSRHLDGADQLAAAGGRWAGLWLRLHVKLNDALWWRARQSSDPWDAGYLMGEPQALQRFQPRRATLIVADAGVNGAALREALYILQSNSAAYRHPVRLLIVGRTIDALARSSTPSNSVAITEIAWPSEDAVPGSTASVSIASASR